MYSSVSLLFSDMSYGRGKFGTFIAGYLCHFIPPCIKGLAGPYMSLYMTEYLVVSGKLCIITPCIYALKFDVPGQ